ncbi:MAG: CHASE2 domain-containing protein, partial [Bacteroidetes bacterium]|nr:CHASE2 domain-containing protein [Bacteroidota bacterium]
MKHSILVIDDESFIGLGGWPFPRTFYAKAILNLHEAGAKLIIVDVEFLEPKETQQDRL